MTGQHVNTQFATSSRFYWVPYGDPKKNLRTPRVEVVVEGYSFTFGFDFTTGNLARIVDSHAGGKIKETAHALAASVFKRNKIVKKDKSQIKLF